MANPNDNWTRVREANRGVFQFASIDLPAGATGATGATGAAGADGTNGTNGADGVGAPGLYGDGSDGVLNYDGSATILGVAPSAGAYTLGRDIYLASGSQVSGSAVLNTNGFRIFCRGTFTIGASATVRNIGGAGNTGASTGAAPTTSVKTLGFSRGGGIGATGLGSGLQPTALTPGMGGNGGTGGDESGGPGTGGGAGAGGASGTAGTFVEGRPNHAMQAIGGFAQPTSAGAVLPFLGGGGGGGGDSTASSTAGAGGAGGGVLGLYASTIVNNGVLSVRGGNGGDATGTGTGAGGGGGGGGGAMFIVTNSLTGNAPVVGGGTGGAAQGAGKNGANGDTGYLYQS